jgi:hypothetical protein
MRERKIRQLDRTTTRLERILDSVPELLSDDEIKSLSNFKKRINDCCHILNLKTETPYKRIKHEKLLQQEKTMS